MREWMAKLCFGFGIVALGASLVFPYWQLRVVAPQYPKGLGLVIYLNKTSGDVQEINTLNHYIGMRRIDEAAKTERRFAIPGMIIVTLGLLAALLFTKRWSVWFALPAVFFPIIFASDLYWWLRDSGLDLNPKAPLSSSIKPFIPPLLGHGKIAQFQALAQFGYGFYLSVLAAALTLIGLFVRFRSGRHSFKQYVFAVLVTGFSVFSLAPASLAETLTVSPRGPYFEIQKAVENAKDQDTILVQGGVYQGPFVIDKSVHLIGIGRPVLDGGGKGTVIKFSAPNSVLKGFVIRNSGDILSRDDAGVYATGKNILIEDNHLEDVLFGIYLGRAPDSVIRGNVLKSQSVTVARRGDLIRIWYSDHILIEQNQVFEGRDSVIWYSKDSVIQNNFFQGGRYGLHFMYCNNAIVERNRLQGNSVGVYLMYSKDIRLHGNQIIGNRGPSGYGLGFKDMDGAIIGDNVIAGNRTGLYLDGATGIFQKNTIAHNDIGIQMLTSASQNQFVDNNFMDNGEQILIEGMSYLTSNQWNQNFWSDYQGYDLNQDGVGDKAYQAVQFFERLTDRYHVLTFFRSSPSVEALEFATSLFPVFAPRPKFADQNPRMEPLSITEAGKSSISWIWVMVSAGLLSFPLGLAAILKRTEMMLWRFVS